MRLKTMINKLNKFSSCRFKNYKRNSAVLLVVSLILIYFYFGLELVSFTKSSSRAGHAHEIWHNKYQPYSSSMKSENKLILFWTKSWSSKSRPVDGWEISISDLQNCPFRCDVTSERNLLDVSDALVYHGTNYGRWSRFYTNYIDKFPARNEKNWKQQWIWFLIEPPTMDDNSLRRFDNVFNWTATYRIDSDLPFRYGTFEPLETQTQENQEFHIRNQTMNGSEENDLIGWMNSHCHTTSEREDIVSKLSQFIPVTIYGKCGSGRLYCGSRSFCYESMAEKHKFWISFENSLCLYYLSEKFYVALDTGMIPIVYAHPSFTSLVPKGSYINIADFKTMKDLADYVRFLDKNNIEYLKYFEWKKQFKIVLWPESSFWCDLCTKLYTNSTKKSYDNLHDWWFTNYTDNSVCANPSSIWSWLGM